jgi:hypothetical protein
MVSPTGAVESTRLESATSLAVASHDEDQP